MDLRRNLRGGHPWVFEDAVRVPPGTSAGIVRLCESGRDARFVAYGLCQPDSPLVFRVLSLDEAVFPGPELVVQRLSAAVGLRRRFVDLSQTDAYRLVHGEGDLLPGLTCDLYAGVAVLKYDNAAARAFYDPVVASWLERDEAQLGVQACYERTYERAEGQPRGVVRFGKVPGSVDIRESGLRYRVDLYRGQKTGFFLDQRENRHLLQGLAADQTVLNCFCYTGGFSVAAAVGGARHVTSVDIAASVVEAARQNFVLNGLDVARHAFHAEDAFAFLRAAAEAGRRYDIVILDPPSFAPSEKAKPKALAAYRDLNGLGLRVLAEGGVLCTSSCSSHVGEADLLAAVRDAAAQLRRALRVTMKRGAGPDHPVPPAFHEGNYLKFIVAT